MALLVGGGHAESDDDIRMLSSGTALVRCLCRKVLGAALATAAGLYGLGVTVGAPDAYANVASAPYTIGVPTSAVGSPQASPANAVQGLTTNFVVKFLVTSAVPSAQGGSVAVASSQPLGTLPSNITLIDDTDTACFQGGTGGGAVTSSLIVVNVVSSCTLSAGDTVEVDFSAEAPLNTGSFYFQVTTSANLTPATTNPVSITASPPTFSAGTGALGANTTYTISGAVWASSALTGTFNVLVLQAQANSGTALSWYPGAAGYSVTYVTSGGRPAADMVAAAAVSGSPLSGGTVSLVLASALSAGETLIVVGRGTNPSVASADGVEITPASGALSSSSAVGPAEVSSNDVLFGTSVSSVRVSVSPSVAEAAASYTVGFQATSALTGGPEGQICLAELAGPTVFSSEVGILVSDTTAGWHFVAMTVLFPSGSPPAASGCGTEQNGAVVQVPSGYDIRAGDSVTLTLANVTNPSAGQIADFSVATSTDTLPADAAPYTIGAGAG
ncbi:MAG TPA: hypothetical protein VK425_02045, partial [Acidimicrobiales bacterium]|nr:hypothetical protein [Acidimicrobiales bacterium]